MFVYYTTEREKMETVQEKYYIYVYIKYMCVCVLVKRKIHNDKLAYNIKIKEKKVIKRGRYLFFVFFVKWMTIYYFEEFLTNFTL